MKETKAGSKARRGHKPRREKSPSRDGKQRIDVAPSEDLSPMSEAEFLERVASSYRIHGAAMIRRGRYRGLRDAEDAMHDVYLSVLRAPRKTERVIRYLPKRQMDRGSTALWRQSRRSRREVPLLDEMAALRGAPDPGLERLDLMDEVAVLLEGLNPSHRQVLRLMYMEGWDLQTICQQTGLKMGTLKNRLHRARSAARVELDRVRKISTRIATRPMDGRD